jgi:hypothetical protein
VDVVGVLSGVWSATRLAEWLEQQSGT